MGGWGCVCVVPSPRNPSQPLEEGMLSDQGVSPGLLYPCQSAHLYLLTSELKSLILQTPDPTVRA